MTLSSAAWKRFPFFSSSSLSVFTSAWKNATATPARRFALGVSVVVTAAPLIAIIQASVLLRDFRHLHGHAPVPITPSQGVVVAVRNNHHQDHDDDDDNDDEDFSRQDNDNDMATATTVTTESGRFKKALDMMRKRLAQGGEHWHEDPSDGIISLESTSSSSYSSSSNSSSNMKFGSMSEPSPPPLRILVIGDSLAAGVGVSQNATPILPEMIARTLSQKLHGRPVYWTCIGTPGANVTRIVQDIESYQENATLLVRHTSLIRPDDDDIDKVTDTEQLALFPAGNRLKTWWKERPTRVQKAIQRLEDKKHDDEKGNDNSNDDGNDKKKSSTITNLVTTPKKKLQLWGELLQSDFSTLQEAWKGGGDDSQAISTPPPPPVELPPMDPFQLWQKWKQRLQRRTDTTVVGHYDVAIVLTGLNDLKEAVLPSFMMMQNGKNNNNSFGSISRTMSKKQSQSQSPPPEHGTSSSSSLQQPQDATTINQESNDATTTKATPGLKDELERVLKALQNRMKLALDGRATGSSHGNDSSSGISSRGSSDVATSDHSQQTTALVELPTRSDSGENSTPPRQESLSIFSIPAIGRVGDGDDRDHNDTSNNNIRNIRRRPLVVFPALPASVAPVFQSPPLSWFAMPLIRRVDAYKMAMARQFPGEVLFVPAPSMQELNELEAKMGPLWKASRGEQVLLQLTDVTQTVRDRVERLMKEHYYEKWNTNQQQQQQESPRGDDSRNNSSSDNDNDDKDRNTRRSRPAAPSSSSPSSSLSASVPPRFSSGGYSNSQQEESLSAFEHEYYNDEPSAGRRPGQSLVGADLVHPNDKGYEFWGRHIGLAIAREWQVHDEQQTRKRNRNGQ